MQPPSETPDQRAARTQPDSRRLGRLRRERLLLGRRSFAAVLLGVVVGASMPLPQAWAQLPGKAPGPAAEVSVEEAARRLAVGGYAVLMRHAATDPGVGDPAGFSLEDCATQRNLSAAGRADAAAVGQALRARGVRFDDVRSSAWCRCIDTARLSFGEPRIWPALNSTFNDSSRQAAQTAAVRAELQRIAPPRNVLLVTHQVNISAITGLPAAPGEMIAVRWRDGAAYPEFRFRVTASQIQR